MNQQQAIKLVDAFHAVNEAVGKHNKASIEMSTAKNYFNRLKKAAAKSVGQNMRRKVFKVESECVTIEYGKDGTTVKIDTICTD